MILKHKNYASIVFADNFDFSLKNTFFSLLCDVECQRALRNKRLAEILNVSRPNVVGAASAYTAFLKNKLKTNYKEVLDIEDSLIELVHDLNAVSYS